MARLHTDNLLLKNISGRIGQFVVRRKGDKAFLCKMPVGRKGKPTPSQEANQEKFKAATRYAREVINDPELKAEYAARAKSGQSAYNLAMADAYQAPVITDLETRYYLGNVGDKIMMRVIDNFYVASVWVTIFDADDEILEDGPAVLGINGLDWTYTATRANESLEGSTILVGAIDLPLNYTSLDKTL